MALAILGAALASGAFTFAAEAPGQGETATSVRTPYGTVHGVTVGGVEQFRGIPYATPPLGDLRWRSPMPPIRYPSGALQATRFPPPCMQANASTELPAPNEDCLYLNLYRPAGSTGGRRMPVLVYVHGGGFASGSASARGARSLAATNDMIVVAINYRLGVFGWLALAGLDGETANGAPSGNYGLLDMVAALRWVQENVAAFGGDRNSVTIQGISAGGIGVCALMTAPLRETLFHRAIIQSGECTNTSGFITSHHAALRQGAHVAASAGCTDPAAFTACLRAKTAPDLLSSSTGLGPFTANVGGQMMPKAPIEAIQSGDLRRIPVIVGATHDEQRRSPIATTGFPATRKSYDTYLSRTFGPLAPLVALQYPISAFSDPAYAAGAAASDSGVPNGIGVCPMLVELAGALAKVTTTFAYEFNDPHGSGVQEASGFEPGSLHTAELGFLFEEAAPRPRTPPQDNLAARMQRYWGTFARSGRPRDEDREWRPLDVRRQGVLRLQPSGDVVVELPALSAEHRCAFWAQSGY